MKRLTVLTAIACAVACGQTVNAETQKGSTEVGAQLALQVDLDNDTGTYFGAAKLGYFYSDALELVGNLTYVGSTGTADFSAFGVVFGPDYHFNTEGNYIPYVGVYGGAFLFDSGGTTSTAGSIDMHVGLKQFLGERTAVDYRISYNYISASGTALNQMLFSIGINYYF